MKKLFFILTFATCATLHLFAAEKSKPNIVFLFADDLGIEGINCYGSDRFKGKTPNIDALAKGGMKFERGFSTPLCGPSRCQIMTGRYGFRTGGYSNQTAGAPSVKSEPSLAKTLKQAGYATGMAGKWRQMGETPGDWGFDEYITDPTGGGWFWKDNYIKNFKEVKEKKEVYVPDVCRDFAIDFFKRHKDEPFYFYYPTHLVHGPILRTPDTKPGVTEFEALYDDNLAYLDKQVGQLVAELDKLGLREKTLIIFSIDNGTAKRSFTIGGRQINGSKGSMLEGGVRVPLIANWKGTTPAGKVSKDLVDFSDFFPTFAELAGAKLPKEVKLDGKSFAPQLHGKKGNPRDWIFVQLHNNWYVRSEGWKLNQAGELFDMSDAPFVEKSVAVEGQPREAKAAREKLQKALDELNPASGKAPARGEEPGKMKKRKRPRSPATS
jgi:arylsulfatase A